MTVPELIEYITHVREGLFNSAQIEAKHKKMAFDHLTMAMHEIDMGHIRGKMGLADETTNP